MGDKVVVRGYHVTSPDKANAILADGFIPSRNDYDWLGDGVYFFQEAVNFALNWGAEDRMAGKFEKLVVLGADIEIDYFMDLLDFRWGAMLQRAYQVLDEEGHEDFRKIQARQKEFSFGVDARQGHWLDRYVVQYAIDTLVRAGKPVNGVRSVFFEGALLYPKSHLADRQHIQIAVRDESTILRRWKETEVDRPAS